MIPIPFQLSNFSLQKKIGTCCCLLPLVLSGCAAPQKPELGHSSPLAQDMVTSAAEKIHDDLLELRSILDGQGKTIPPSTHSYTGPLTQPITLSWAGPAIPALETVATLIGFRLETQGHLSKTGPIIRIEAQNRPALSVLEDIGWQCGPSMGVVVKESEKTIYVFFEK